MCQCRTFDGKIGGTSEAGAGTGSALLCWHTTHTVRTDRGKFARTVHVSLAWFLYLSSSRVRVLQQLPIDNLRYTGLDHTGPDYTYVDYGALRCL